MDEEDKKLLQEVLEISRDNQKKIARLYRNLWWSRVWSWIYWAFIIGSAFGAYYLIQPYFDYLKSAYGGLQDNTNNAQNQNNAFQNFFQ
ncbi:MAG: hypothetical protein A3C06_01465 [Candidatus Taylorbacteria bacterium RIFCSPHIGHO2_02_FULL_46_13]|uniref:Uncharacterized protein n=1 Tax=Candidatus Taylorbacteria bacterium RIFCSPHIGHO2_02_FULL_46_13 TaxID=1802312 RepID=A0A1G2MU64_9BACT|nr:MAG: hypothetical protein A3C06_01465 [Candidatus Taylorbacteria bacterium RIFCSPHIGHO2_02_FULL_46_13]